MIRPGTRATPGIGRKTEPSTPTGTTEMCSGATPSWSAMSRRDDSETVTIRCTWRATRACILTKPYQRLRVNRRRHPSA